MFVFQKKAVSLQCEKNKKIFERFYLKLFKKIIL